MLKAFTLIELLTVLAMIAILLIIVTSFALNAVKQSKATQVAFNLRNIRTAAESYVFVRKPATQSHLDLNDLVNSGYLVITENLLQKYQFSASRTNDSFEATVTYDGDVDIDRLKNILPEATKINDVLNYPFKIPIYW